jgi:hypothetical protein
MRGFCAAKLHNAAAFRMDSDPGLQRYGPLSSRIASRVDTASSLGGKPWITRPR